MGDSQFLTTVTPSLSSRGIEKEMLYYSTEQVSQKIVESNNLKGKLSVGVNSLSMGSTGTVTIPNSDFIGATMCYIELPKIADTNILMPSGWGYRLLKNVSYLFGASNQSLLQISGETIFQKLLTDCETAEKVTAMLGYGGHAYDVNTNRDANPSCNILIPTPWSTIRNELSKRLFDTSLLSSQIEIQITWADPNEIFGLKTGAPIPVFPTSLTRAELYVQSDVLVNRAESMKQVLSQNSALQVNYGYIHTTNGTKSYLPAADSATRQTVNLQSFLNSDLLGITFMCVKSADLKSTLEAGSVPNPWNTLSLKNIELEYNGQRLHQYHGKACQLEMARLDKGAGVAPSTVVKIDGTSAAATTHQVMYLPFTAFKSTVFNAEFQNSSAFANQTMTLSFDIEGLAAPTPVTVTTAYYYNALNSVSGGTSHITFGGD
jgi:hypothetical protein